MSKVDDILKLLDNGKWHDLQEIGECIHLQDVDIASVAEFLVQFKFIKLDKKGRKAKLDLSTQDFLKRIQQIESEEKP